MAEKGKNVDWFRGESKGVFRIHPSQSSYYARDDRYFYFVEPPNEKIVGGDPFRGFQPRDATVEAAKQALAAGYDIALPMAEGHGYAMRGHLSKNQLVDFKFRLAIRQ